MEKWNWVSNNSTMLALHHQRSVLWPFNTVITEQSDHAEDQVKKSDEENNITFKLSRRDMEINHGFGLMSTHIFHKLGDSDIQDTFNERWIIESPIPFRSNQVCTEWFNLNTSWVTS